jgi:hypothetical protein
MMTTSPLSPRSGNTIREKRKGLFFSSLAKVSGGVALILMVAAVFQVAVSNLWEVPEVEVGASVAAEVVQPSASGSPSVMRGGGEAVAEPMALSVEESEEGRVMVDLESSVRYGELPWREFVQARPGRPTLLRVLASQSERIPSAVGSEISGAMRVWSVKQPSDSEPLEAIFDAEDPVLGPLMGQLEAGEWKNVPVTLLLCFSGAETNSETKMARITAVEGRGWLILSQKRS